MGFFEKLNNFMQGKPVFTPEEHAASNRSEQTNMQASAHGIEHADAKVIPKIYIERTHCHTNGSHMEVRAEIKNESSQQIEIDKIFILGIKREVDVHLRPHESREALLYSGPRPKHQNYSQADINYKNQDPDYFQLKCRVEYKPAADGTFSIYRITGQGPIKDIQ